MCKAGLWREEAEPVGAWHLKLKCSLPATWTYPFKYDTSVTPSPTLTPERSWDLSWEPEVFPVRVQVSICPHLSTTQGGPREALSLQPQASRNPARHPDASLLSLALGPWNIDCIVLYHQNVLPVKVRS